VWEHLQHLGDDLVGVGQSNGGDGLAGVLDVNFFTVDENGVITGVKYNLDWKMKYKTLRVTYKGKTLTCMIYVKNAE
jgi:hypothetical protein